MNIVTPEEFATIQKVNRITVYSLLNNGKMPFKFWKVGQQWRIDLDATRKEDNEPEAN